MTGHGQDDCLSAERGNFVAPDHSRFRHRPRRGVNLSDRVRETTF